VKNLAGADENRTHRGRDTPPYGFEDRERHQTTYYSRVRQVTVFLEKNPVDFTSRQITDASPNLLIKFTSINGYLSNFFFCIQDKWNEIKDVNKCNRIAPSLIFRYALAGF
jgi:hypothetical protein